MHAGCRSSPRRPAGSLRPWDTQPPAPGFDVITTLVFENRAAYETAFAALKRPEIAARISADEERLFDRGNITAYIVDDYASDL